MKAFVLLSLMLALTTVADALQDKVPPKPTLPKGTAAEQIKTLIAQHETATAEIRKLYLAGKTEEEQDKLEALYPDPAPYATLLLEIAEKHPKDAAAIDALIWSSRHDRSGKAKTILLRDHLLNPKIGRVCLSMRHESDEAVQKALRTVLADNPDKKSQACAAYSLAYQFKSSAKLALLLQKANAKELSKWEENYSKAEIAALKKADAAALLREAEQLLDRIVKDKTYAERTIDHYGESGSSKLGEMAARELYELRHLQPGMPAPEIVGEDIDGKPMKLSDFRGTVVLLDFWAFWCGSCLEMNKHAHALVKKLEGKPFVIVGVNCDPDRENVKAKAAKKGPPWRSFWDGGSTNGPIQNQWNIQHYPTMYLIDHKGIIVDQTYPMLQGIELIERTVKAAEGALR